MATAVGLISGSLARLLDSIALERRDVEPVDSPTLLGPVDQLAGRIRLGNVKTVDEDLPIRVDQPVDHLGIILTEPFVICRFRLPHQFWMTAVEVQCDETAEPDGRAIVHPSLPWDESTEAANRARARSEGAPVARLGLAVGADQSVELAAAEIADDRCGAASGPGGEIDDAIAVARQAGGRDRRTSAERFRVSLEALLGSGGRNSAQADRRSEQRSSERHGIPPFSAGT